MTDIAAQTRLALRRLASSVAVVTTLWEGQRIAMAASAVEGLSLDPPSMLLCINQRASLTEPLKAGQRFAINLLGLRHGHLPARCSSPWQGEERFAEADWQAGAGGVPILADAQASFLCAPDLITPYGTHNIVVGRIEDVRIDSTMEPMVWADGALHALSRIMPAD